MTSIRALLEEEIKEAKVALEKTIGTVLDQAAERNQKRKRKRAVAGKRLRERGAASGDRNIPLPERAATYQAFAQLQICQQLLKDVSLLEEGQFDHALDAVARHKLRIGSARQNAKFDQYFLLYLTQLRAKLSRLRSVPEAEESEPWSQAKIQAMLGVRVRALWQGLSALEFQKLSDPVAATIYLREYARWAVVKRFHTSHHLQDADQLKQVSPIIKVEIPSDFPETYGEAGREAWREAVDDFTTEMIARHLPPG